MTVSVDTADASAVIERRNRMTMSTAFSARANPALSPVSRAKRNFSGIAKYSLSRR